MHQRQIEERPQSRRRRQIEAAGDGGVGDRARLRIGGEGPARAAMQVARKLVEQQQQRQRPLPRLREGVAGAGGGGLARGSETAPDLRVEGVVAREPGGGAGLDPEADDFRWRRVHSRPPMARAASIADFAPKATNSAPTQRVIRRSRRAKTRLTQGSPAE